MASWTPTDYDRRKWASHRLARAEYDRAHRVITGPLTKYLHEREIAAARIRDEYDRAHAEDVERENEEHDRVREDEERNRADTNEWGHQA